VAVCGAGDDRIGRRWRGRDGSVSRVLHRLESYAYAKVRRLDDALKLGARTEIEHFDGLLYWHVNLWPDRPPLKAAAAKLIRSMTEFERAPEALRAERSRLAEAIERP
jgi:hypothetical protein